MMKNLNINRKIFTEDELELFEKGGYGVSDISDRSIHESHHSSMIQDQPSMK